jgi:poly(A) polymerase
LSVERVAKEILKLLGAENPVPSWQLMIDNGIVKYIAPEATDITRIQTLLENEKRYDSDLNALLRFAALLPPKESVAMATATHLKFSKRDNEKLCAYARLAPLMHDKLDPIPLRRTLYSQGAENCRAALLLLRQEISEPLAIVAAWENPKFPIQGEDIIKRGIAPGPQVGKALGDIEAWWISNDFRPDRAACLEQIKKSA